MYRKLGGDEYTQICVFIRANNNCPSLPNPPLRTYIGPSLFCINSKQTILARTHTHTHTPIEHSVTTLARNPFVNPCVAPSIGGMEARAKESKQSLGLCVPERYYLHPSGTPEKGGRRRQQQQQHSASDPLKSAASGSGSTQIILGGWCE